MSNTIIVLLLSVSVFVARPPRAGREIDRTPAQQRSAVIVSAAVPVVVAEPVTAPAAEAPAAVVPVTDHSAPQCDFNANPQPPLCWFHHTAVFAPGRR